MMMMLSHDWTYQILLFSYFYSVVEFKDEEFVKKAIETMNKHDLSGRPLNIKEVEKTLSML